MLVNLLVDNLLPLLGRPIVSTVILTIHVLTRLVIVSTVRIWIALANISSPHGVVE